MIARTTSAVADYNGWHARPRFTAWLRNQDGTATVCPAPVRCLALEIGTVQPECRSPRHHAARLIRWTQLKAQQLWAHAERRRWLLVHDVHTRPMAVWQLNVLVDEYVTSPWYLASNARRDLLARPYPAPAEPEEDNARVCLCWFDCDA